MSGDPWQRPAWSYPAVPPPPPPPPPLFPPPLWRRADLVAFVLTTAFVTVAGAAVGLIWAAVAPRLDIRAVAAGSEPAFRSLIGADAWFLLLALLAGIATGAAVWLAGGRGPGAAIGLLTGGILAAFVAERVGFLARRPDTIDSLHGIGLSTAPPVLDLVDFKIRLAAVLLAWPVAALVAHASVLAILPGRDD